jgi:hypothetical protein
MGQHAELVLGILGSFVRCFPGILVMTKGEFCSEDVTQKVQRLLCKLECGERV